ncbi:Uncharacterised protein [Mycobacteroides abscessus subsp. abscessus]|nr:Uncharacterised protein [Mycobacteroides abscessus subsp. abscessus]
MHTPTHRLHRFIANPSDARAYAGLRGAVHSDSKHHIPNGRHPAFQPSLKTRIATKIGHPKYRTCKERLFRFATLCR